jgi:uncharacterized surface protein with fasciclin (FAS1) repeats
MEKKNNKMRMIGAVTAVVLVLGGLGACMSDDDDTTNDATTETSQSQSTIVELAQATDSLSTLVAAVVQAELVDTLSSEGPFTVFAPTNAAFGDLLEALNITAEELLAREDLGAILTYHVVSGEVLAADLSDGQVVTTVQGGELTVSVSDAGVVLTDANGGTATVTAADVDASNGVVHLIDAVVLP